MYSWNGLGQSTPPTNNQLVASIAAPNPEVTKLESNPAQLAAVVATDAQAAQYASESSVQTPFGAAGIPPGFLDNNGELTVLAFVFPAFVSVPIAVPNTALQAALNMQAQGGSIVQVSGNQTTRIGASVPLTHAQTVAVLNAMATGATGTSTGTGLSLSTIPWYVWAGAAGLIVVMLMGDKR